MLRVGDNVVNNYKIIAIEKVKRVFDNKGASKGWVKQYRIQCPNGHNFTRSFHL